MTARQAPAVRIPGRPASAGTRAHRAGPEEDLEPFPQAERPTDLEGADGGGGSASASHSAAQRLQRPERDRPDGGHDPGERLYLPGDSPVHRLPPQTKIAGLVLFVLTVVATPIQWWPVFLAYAAIVAAVLGLARIPVRRVLPRMVVELPFIAFALLLPVLGRPPEATVLGLTLSEPGLWAAANILAKATLGVLAAITLAATTRTADLVTGLRRLRVPAPLVEIASFLVRYIHVVSAQWHRMAQARAARGFTATGPRSWLTTSRSLGALFIRSYERGERVHLAMLSRGYTGEMPELGDGSATRRQWTAALAPALLALVALGAAAALRGSGTLG